MKVVSGGRTRGPTDQEHRWGMLHHYLLDMGANGIPTCFPGFGSGRFDMWGSRELLLPRAPNVNLSPLLAVGLEKGVTIPVVTVMSNAQLQKYTEGLQTAINQFYVDFLRNDEVNIRITVEQF